MEPILNGHPLSDHQYEQAQQIAAWLESEDKDYPGGLALLFPHCTNRVLLQQLQRRENTMNRNKLEYELGKLLTDPTRLKEDPAKAKPLVITPAAPATDTEARSTETESSEEETPNPDQLQQALDAIVLQQSHLYRQKTELSNMLAATGESNEPAAVEDRLHLVQQITDIEAEYNRLAGQKEQILEAASKPAQPAAEPAPEPSQDELKAKAEQKAQLDSLKLKRKALAPNVTKARKAFETKPDDVQKQEKLARLEAEIKELDDRIKLLL